MILKSKSRILTLLIARVSSKSTVPLLPCPLLLLTEHHHLLISHSSISAPF